MASPWIALWFTLATVGAGQGEGEAGCGTLRGKVVGTDGRAVAGAEIVAAGGAWDGDSPIELGRVTADAGGRFALDLRDAPADCDRPTLWAIGGGNVVASIPIDRDAIEGRPIRLVLGSPSGASFVVAGPDGRPIGGARVIPVRVAREGPDVPGAVAKLASATTGRDGRALVQAFRPEEILEVRVEAAGFGEQTRRFGPPGGMAEVGTRSIVLLPVGRVSGRVVAEDPNSVAGLKVRVASSNLAVAEVTTDGAGRFTVAAIAAGPITVRVRPRQGQADLPARVVRRTLDAGQAVEVEIPLRRGVKVAGELVDDKDGRPIAGALVSIVPQGPWEAARTRTDEMGRYEAYVPSGLVGRQVLRAPLPYLCPPPFVGPRPVEVPPAIARFELPKLVLARGVDVDGRVVDEIGRPAAGARVEASWTWLEGRTRTPRSATATTRPDGSFRLGPVAADAEVALTASDAESATARAVTIRPIEGQPVGLTLVEPDAESLSGRVVGRDGRAIASASVRIWAVELSPSGAVSGSSPVRFDGSDALATDADGRYRTPRKLRLGREYVAIASAEGHHPGRSRPFRPTGPASAAFPHLVLDGEPGRVSIAGRVVDRQGRAVAGASVRTAGEGHDRREATTDADGRFTLPDLGDGRAFLFADAVGFRFVGRALDPARGPFDLILTRLDEQPGSGMATLPDAAGNLELARRVIAPYAEKVLGEGDHASRIKTLELLARVDPGRVLALIEAKGVDDAWFADHLRHAASCHLTTLDPDERMAIVEPIRDLEWRVLARLDAADALPGSARGLKRECVAQALRDARSIADPARKVASLVRVVDRLIDLGEVESANRSLAEARPIAESLPATGSGGMARAEFAERLARVDPAGAVSLADDLLDPGRSDRCRLRIARGVAARDPAFASKVLDSLRDPRSLAAALPELCHALASVDPRLARQLIAGVRTDDPSLPPYALGMMALAVSDKDKPAATIWLREAFDRLARVATWTPPTSPTAHDPATVAAALLPVAERVDPRLVPELFWRAVSLRTPPPGAEGRSEALLALLLARYDRGVALSLFEPVAARAFASGGVDLAPLLAASAVLDSDLAVQLVESLPEAPDLTFHHPKNQARLVLAAAIARGTPGCWEHVNSEFLKLWTVSIRLGNGE